MDRTRCGCFHRTSRTAFVVDGVAKGNEPRREGGTTRETSRVAAGSPGNCLDCGGGFGRTDRKGWRLDGGFQFFGFQLEVNYGEGDGDKSAEEVADESGDGFGNPVVESRKKGVGEEKQGDYDNEGHANDQ